MLFYLLTDQNSVSSLRIYSPISAWWKQTVVNGSAALHSAVERAVMPNPSGRSLIEYTTTPWCFGVFSVIRPSPDFGIWFPYKNCCSTDDFSQILYLKRRTFIFYWFIHWFIHSFIRSFTVRISKLNRIHWKSKTKLAITFLTRFCMR